MSNHESSIIHPSAEIDENVEIGPFCIVREKVKIKSGSKLLSHVVLKGPTTVGKNNVFYQFCTIGEDTPDKKFKGEETTLEIGDENIFREDAFTLVTKNGPEVPLQAQGWDGLKSKAKDGEAS